MLDLSSPSSEHDVEDCLESNYLDSHRGNEEDITTEVTADDSDDNTYQSNNNNREIVSDNSFDYAYDLDDNDRYNFSESSEAVFEYEFDDDMDFVLASRFAYLDDE